MSVFFVNAYVSSLFQQNGCEQKECSISLKLWMDYDNLFNFQFVYTLKIQLSVCKIFAKLYNLLTLWKITCYRSESEVEGEPNVPAVTPAVTQSQSEAQQALATFWTKVTDEIRKIGTVSIKIGLTLGGKVVQSSNCIIVVMIN